jgi:hypothetical protein
VRLAALARTLLPREGAMYPSHEPRPLPLETPKLFNVIRAEPNRVLSWVHSNPATLSPTDPHKGHSHVLGPPSTGTRLPRLSPHFGSAPFVLSGWSHFRFPTDPQFRTSESPDALEHSSYSLCAGDTSPTYS